MNKQRVFETLENKRKQLQQTNNISLQMVSNCTLGSWLIHEYPVFSSSHLLDKIQLEIT